ncbi:alkaline phosphatase family protein [Streptomyces sp. NBC_00237]|uniref:alkaline phosphatase family protein n=1 Tax=Streptomyces sp. NBC_00237 TaxID=2975687 RepID=UPI002259C41F|nr:alkaline phosphatase family protein [Streptomyces sp. NBC_00237]MCX5200980.1 alkaline phosphatase family protein [Streptomyces sp. NBC_00237]
MSQGISRRAVLLGAAAVAATAGPLASATSAAAAERAGRAAKTPKVLVIGLDGAMVRRIKDADAPNLDALMASGVTAPSSIYTNPMAPTSSGPGWSTLITGVWPDKHKVVNNDFTGHNLAQYPDFMTRAEAARPALKTYAVASWNPVTDVIFSAKVDERVSTPSAEYDTGTTKRAVARVATDVDAVFVHLDNVDHAGHASGNASQAYLDALHGVDTQVGEIVAAVKSRATYGDEDWLIMITADHGHTATGGHGGDSWDERQTFLIASGGGLPAGVTRHDVKMPDVAVSALHHLGVAVDPAWGLDGRAVQQAVPDAFDSLRGSLQKRVDETGVGADVLGFTHVAPSGWSVDNSAMGTGGVTEWRGWSFTTDEFWTQAEKSQQRELNVRARNVFAVADGDEWTDRTFTGTFDSTLISPKFTVAPGTAATLTYTTYYRQESPQKGEVLVSYGSAAPVVVKTYTANTSSRVERITLQVPAGATTAQVRFRYTGGNNWYWTIDGVSITA